MRDMYLEILRIRKIDWRAIFPVIGLMIISLLVISSATNDPYRIGEEVFMTPCVKVQLQWYAIGWLAYFLFASFDYKRIRNLSFAVYLVMVVCLVGLFFTTPIQGVRRWYRIPGVMGFQPSEMAKLVVIVQLSFLLEKYKSIAHRFWPTVLCCVISFIPFALVLKQPDLGSALILLPQTLVMLYYGSANRWIIRTLTTIACLVLSISSLMLLGVLSHEKLRPFATTILKSYQYERLNPQSYHQDAAQTAIGLGGVVGSGWQKSEFTLRHFLPYGHTDSVFPAFVEEFGLLGGILVLVLFFLLIYRCFQVSAIAKEDFGRLLSAGITTYLAVHILMNIGMMCGILPITGVPLILVSYGGTSLLFTMVALGILQSVYAERLM